MSSPNKATVQAWIDGLCTSPIDVPKLATLFGPVYRGNHLPYPPFEGAAEQFLSTLKSMMPEGQAPSIKVKRMVEEGDQVWVWSNVTMMGVTKETVDIVTFKDGKIVEHYDVQQEGIYEMKE